MGWGKQWTIISQDLYWHSESNLHLKTKAGTWKHYLRDRNQVFYLVYYQAKLELDLEYFLTEENEEYSQWPLKGISILTSWKKYLPLDLVAALQ